MLWMYNNTRALEKNWKNSHPVTYARSSFFVILLLRGNLTTANVFIFFFQNQCMIFSPKSCSCPCVVSRELQQWARKVEEGQVPPQQPTLQVKFSILFFPICLDLTIISLSIWCVEADKCIWIWYIFIYSNCKLY